MDESLYAYCQKHNINVFLWLGDSPFLVKDITDNTDYYDKIFSWDPYYIPVLACIANKTIHYLPAAGDDEIYFNIPETEKDIDILFYDQLILNDEWLTIPHVGIPERATVLVPLAEIAPSWNHPRTGLSVAEMVTAVDRSGIKHFAPPFAMADMG